MNDRLIAVAWNGLPAYGARLIQQARDDLGQQFPVVATRPNVPIEGMLDILRDNLYWIDPNRPNSWSDLELPIPDVFFHTGWRYLHFSYLADEVRAAGGTVIGMFDNCWKPTLRQFLGSIYFRLFLRDKFHAAFVPGRSGCRLAKQIGFNAENTYTGMYGASGDIFFNEVPILRRQKQILFVGQLINRKGVLELVEAFKLVMGDFPDWRLVIVGEGELHERIGENPQIKRLAFQQPNEVAKLMNESRIFALPSREEHWGLVVHEAALCGCSLLVQSHVGASHDLAGIQNSVKFERTSVSLIEKALRQMLQWEDGRFDEASSASLELAGQYGPGHWSETFRQIISAI